MRKSQFILAVFLVSAFSWSNSADAAPKPTTAKAAKKPSKAKVAELVDNAFGSIWIDSDMEDADIEYDLRVALDAGGSPDSKDKYGDTLLLQAIVNNRTGVANLLLRRGANVNLPDSDPKSGDTPLIRAVSTSDVWAEGAKPLTQLVKLLLRHGADPNRFNKRGETALTLAATNGQSEIAAALIKAGANIHLPSKKGETPLWLASQPVPPNSIYYMGGGFPSVANSNDPKQFEKAFAAEQKMLEKRARAEELRLSKGRVEVKRLLLKASAKH